MRLIKNNRNVETLRRKRAIALLLIVTLMSMLYIHKHIESKHISFEDVLDKYNIKAEDFLEETVYDKSKVNYDLFQSVKKDLSEELFSINKNVIGMEMPNLHLGSPVEYEVENINLKLKDYYNYDKELIIAYIPFFSYKLEEDIKIIEEFSKKKNVDVLYLDVGSSFEQINNLSKNIGIEGKIYKNYNNYEIEYFKTTNLPFIYVNDNGFIELVLTKDYLKVLNNLI